MSRLNNIEVEKEEIGKILIFSSIFMMATAIYGFYTMQNLETEMQNSQEQLEQGLEYVESENTQRIIDSLRGTTGLEEQFNTLEEGFRNAENSLNQTRETQEKVQKTKENYQWITLLSIALLISGITLYFV